MFFATQPGRKVVLVAQKPRKTESSATDSLGHAVHGAFHEALRGHVAYPQAGPVPVDLTAIAIEAAKVGKYLADKVAAEQQAAQGGSPSLAASDPIVSLMGKEFSKKNSVVRVAWLYAAALCGFGAFVTTWLTGAPLMSVPFVVVFFAAGIVATVLGRSNPSDPSQEDTFKQSLFR